MMKRVSCSWATVLLMLGLSLDHTGGALAMKTRSLLAVLAVVLWVGTLCFAATDLDPLLMPWEPRSEFLIDVIDRDVLQLLRADCLEEYPIYQVSLSVLDETTICGRQQVLYKNSSSSALEVLCLALLPNMLGGSMTIQNAFADGEEVSVDVEDSLEGLGFLRLPTPLDRGEYVLVELHFTTIVPSAGDAKDPRFQHDEDVLNCAHSFPLIAGQDGKMSLAYYVVRETLFGDFPLNEHALFAVQIKAPVDFQVVASGKAKSTSTEDGITTTTFISGPTNDFYWGGSRRFQVAAETVDDASVRCYAQEGFYAQATEVVQYAKQALLTFSSNIAPYPFTELDIVLTSMSCLTSGAEFSGVILLNQHLFGYCMYFAEMDLADVEAVIVHEVAHQWFPAIVSSDPIMDPWLDESVVQLMTWLYCGERYGTFGHSVFGTRLREYAPQIDADEEMPLLDAPLPAFTELGYGSIVYGLGPLVLWVTIEASVPEPTLEMVRTQGWRFLQAYFEEFAWDQVSTEVFVDFIDRKLGPDSSSVLAPYLSERD